MFNFTRTCDIIGPRLKITHYYMAYIIRKHLFQNFIIYINYIWLIFLRSTRPPIIFNVGWLDWSVCLSVCPSVPLHNFSPIECIWL